MAMISTLEIQYVKGRQLSLGKTKGFHKFHIHEETIEITKNHMFIHDDRPYTEANANELQRPTPVQVTNESQSPPGPPSAGGLDDFRPTAPGRSPGAGHSVHNQAL